MREQLGWQLGHSTRGPGVWIVLEEHTLHTLNCCLRKKGQSASKSAICVVDSSPRAQEVNPACQDSNCWNKVPRWKQIVLIQPTSPKMDK